MYTPTCASPQSRQTRCKNLSTIYSRYTHDTIMTHGTVLLIICYLKLSYPPCTWLVGCSLCCLCIIHSLCWYSPLVLLSLVREWVCWPDSFQWTLIPLITFSFVKIMYNLFSLLLLLQFYSRSENHVAPTCLMRGNKQQSFLPLNKWTITLPQCSADIARTKKLYTIVTPWFS